MDPEETLRLIREKVAEALEESGAKRGDLVDELAELVNALDSWLSMGGYLPPQWSPRQGRHRTVNPVRTEAERRGEPAIRVEDQLLPGGPHSHAWCGCPRDNHTVRCLAGEL